MPPKKRTTRAAQLQPQPAQSDYETDTANFTDTLQTASLAPPPDRSIVELNLQVLRRYSPDISHIITIAPFAVVYHFSAETQAWEKSGIEGTLFVCQLSGAAYPRFNVVILNRKSLDNFITELTSTDDVEVDEHYLMLQATNSEGQPVIYGLWIFSEEDAERSMREVVAESIQMCALATQKAREIMQGGGYVELEAAEEDVGGYGDYGYDGVDESHVVPQAVDEGVGQQIDLMKLFSNPQIQQEDHIHQLPSGDFNGYAPSQQAMPQQLQFNSTPDTDFFRTSSYTPTQDQHAAVQPPVQQNALLDLFKNAKRV